MAAWLLGAAVCLLPLVLGRLSLWRLRRKSKPLTEEGWTALLRRAKAALSTALDPQGNGSLVGWENPDSGNKGTFTPVGKAYPLNAEICRVFLAELDRKGNEQSLQGTACADKQGEWTIAEAKPWKKI